MQLQNNGSGLGWLYEILDTERALGIAAADAKQVQFREQAFFSLVVNLLLAIFFFCVWLRYDLISTGTIFLPVVEKVTPAAISSAPAPTAVPDGPAPENGAQQAVEEAKTAVTATTPSGTWDVLGWIIRLALGITASLFTSLLQAAYPRLAQKHRGAKWALGFSIIFDLTTDYKDVALDFPTYFSGLIAAAGRAEPHWWLIAALVLFLVLLFWESQRPVLLLLVGGCMACLVFDPAVAWRWVVIFVMTVFCSFVVQALFTLHVGKCLILIKRAAKLPAATA